jgi:hypothetical protein
MLLVCQLPLRPPRTNTDAYCARETLVSLLHIVFSWETMDWPGVDPGTESTSTSCIEPRKSAKIHLIVIIARSFNTKYNTPLEYSCGRW